MNYARLYELLIEKRRKHPISKRERYCERHHFIPRCMGGGNEPWNLVNLTGKEHFVAHHLLCKCNPQNGKLLNAFVAMCTKEDCQKGREIYISAKRYDALKKAYGLLRRKMFAVMSDEQRARRNANIKAACANRTPEQKAAIKAKRAAYFASLTDDDKVKILAKRRKTESNRSAARNREIFETISRSHRKMSEANELRVVAEYEEGRTAAEIAAMSWCSLGREGVNCLLRRRGVKTHFVRRWEGKESAICDDFAIGKYATRAELASAYGTTWSVVERILKKNGVVVKKNPNRTRASSARADAQLRGRQVEYASPFSHTAIRSSLYDAIERMRMFGLIPKNMVRRQVLRKIRPALEGRVKYAFGYSWRNLGAAEDLPKGLAPLIDIVGDCDESV